MFAVVSEAWKNADEATKARYKEQAEERKLAERETESEETHEEAKRTRASRTQKEGEDETPAAKRKRGTFRELTGSALFAQEHRQEAVEKSRGRGGWRDPPAEPGDSSESAPPPTLPLRSLHNSCLSAL